MKILLATSSSGSRGDGERCLVSLGRALAQRGHTVLLWASEHPRMDELANSFSGIGEVLRAPYQNTYDHRGRSISSYLDLAAVRQLSLEWQSAQPDFLHLNKQNLEDGLDLLQAARRSGLPSLCTIHIARSAQRLRARLAPARDFVARRGLRNYPGLLVTVSEQHRQHLLEYIGAPARLRTIVNGVPLPDLARRASARALKRAELGFQDRDLLCVALGSLVAHEQPIVFLERAAEILRAQPHAKFLWLGDGALGEAWDEWVAAHGLRAAIHRRPWRSDAPLVLLAADLLLHVGESDGLPLDILEAFAAGLPCAITARHRAEIPLLDATNSVLLSADGAWLETLRDETRLQRIGHAARRVAEENFSCARMAEEYEALYHETLAAA